MSNQLDPLRPRVLQGNAKNLGYLIEKKSVDLIVTSPPYWGHRDYGHPEQIGQELQPATYISTLVATVESWRPLLRPHGSIIINLADAYREGTLVGIPAMFELEIRKFGWLVVNRILWAKKRGVPGPKPYRLVDRYEFVFQLAPKRKFYSDLFALSAYMGQFSNPGDYWVIEELDEIWEVEQEPSKEDHIAPFPSELARRAIIMACPERLCPRCGKPHTRLLEPSLELNPERKQAQRALEIFKQSNLTAEHVAAIRAVGISDAGKGKQLQNGATKNSPRTKQLAEEAKKVLKGYFREFTFAPKKQTGWQACKCGVDPCSGLVLDPFMGTGTTLRVARELNRRSIGVDLNLPEKLDGYVVSGEDKDA